MTFDTLKILYLYLIDLGVTFGLVKKGKVFKILIGMIFIPVILAILWNSLKSIFMQFGPYEQFMAIIGGIIFILMIILVGTRFGKEVLASMLGDLLYDLFKFIVRLSLAIGKGIMRIFQRN